MYLGYVTNCKFTSVNTWAAINFMRSSLVEVYLLDPALSYTVAFPFIRQLAIHLRNAVTAGTTEQVKQGKKEASRIVYSWQFLHSVHVWIELLAQAIGAGDESLRLLLYPLVQVL
jgi:nucleolar complex protein 2